MLAFKVVLAGLLGGGSAYLAVKYLGWGIYTIDYWLVVIPCVAAIGFFIGAISR